MKKLILILLLFPSLAWAVEPINFARMNMPMMGAGVAAASTVYCSACPDATNGGDVLCEIPDGTSNGLCNWTVTSTDDAKGAVNFNASCDDSPALSCTNINTSTGKCATFVKTNATAGEMRAELTVTTSSLKIQLYVKPTEIASLGNNSMSNVIVGVMGSSGGSAIIRIATDGSGNPFFALSCHNTAGWENQIQSTQISADSWYGVRLTHINSGTAGADECSAQFDYSNNGTWSEATQPAAWTSDKNYDRASTYVRLGEASTTTISSWMTTGVKVDASDYPNGCDR